LRRRTRRRDLSSCFALSRQTIFFMATGITICPKNLPHDFPFPPLASLFSSLFFLVPGFFLHRVLRTGILPGPFRRKLRDFLLSWRNFCYYGVDVSPFVPYRPSPRPFKFSVPYPPIGVTLPRLTDGFSLVDFSSFPSLGLTIGFVT